MWKTNECDQKKAGDNKAVENVNFVVVSDSLTVTDTYSNENNEGFNLNRYPY